MEEAVNLLQEIIIKNVRPYLGKKELFNLSAILENKNNNLNGNSKVDLITKENLIAISKVPQFQQLLFESNLKLSDAEYFLRLAIKQNNKLKDIIKSELKDNY